MSHQSLEKSQESMNIKFSILKNYKHQNKNNNKQCLWFLTSVSIHLRNFYLMLINWSTIDFKLKKSLNPTSIDFILYKNLNIINPSFSKQIHPMDRQIVPI